MALLKALSVSMSSVGVQRDAADKSSSYAVDTLPNPGQIDGRNGS